MAQGKAWKKEEKNRIIQSLREYLELGYSRNKACEFIGLTPSTLSNWVKADNSLGMKLTGWQNKVNIQARKNIVEAIENEQGEKDTKKETSKWWAERKMKADFSTRTENISEVITSDISEQRKEEIKKALLE